jgi:hypothetical protein
MNLVDVIIIMILIFIFNETKVKYRKFCYEIFNPKVIVHYDIINLPLPLPLPLLLCINYRSIDHYTDKFQSIDQSIIRHQHIYYNVNIN